MSTGIHSYDGSAWKTYTVDDGLFGDSTKCIAVAPDGSVWVGTAKGVSGYDGKAWQTYTADEVLLSDTIVAIAIDAEGTIAFGCAKGVTVLTP